jgi:hypothetical protein
MEAAHTRDFCRLGIKLAELIYLSEYAVAEADIVDGDVRRDSMRPLPYNNSVDALPVAARALLERDAVKYADIADILHIKFCTIRWQYETARTIALAAMKRSPQEVFWYYICSLLVEQPTDAEKKLRWAKRGLACPNKGYIRYCLLNIATNAAVLMGINILETERNGSPRLALGLALLHSARDDCLKFLNEAPPDSRQWKKC